MASVQVTMSATWTLMMCATGMLERKIRSSCLSLVKNLTPFLLHPVNVLMAATLFLDLLKRPRLRRSAWKISKDMIASYASRLSREEPAEAQNSSLAKRW